MHLDRGYDSLLTTQRCQAAGLTDVVRAKKRRKGEAKIKKPLTLGLRWPVERTNSWLSNFGQLRRNTDRFSPQRLGQIALAISLILADPRRVGHHYRRVCPSRVRDCQECLFTAGHLEAGQTAPIHAGAGGVGMAAIQLAKHAGATVISTASSDEKLERLSELGLDHGINYARENFVERARELTDGRGAAGRCSTSTPGSTR
jgi:Zinc-binding dehydrogenase